MCSRDPQTPQRLLDAHRLVRSIRSHGITILCICTLICVVFCLSVGRGLFVQELEGGVYEGHISDQEIAVCAFVHRIATVRI